MAPRSSVSTSGSPQRLQPLWEGAKGRFVAVVGDATLASTWTQAANAAADEGGARFLINVAGFSQLEDNALTLT